MLNRIARNLLAGVALGGAAIIAACGDEGSGPADATHAVLEGTTLVNDRVPLPGVGLELRRGGTVLGKTSDAQGEFAFDGLESGVWSLFVTPPQGFMPAPDQPSPHQVAVGVEGKPAFVAVSFAHEDGTGSLEMFVTASDTIGAEIDPVSGATIQVFEHAGTEIMATAETDETGYVTFLLEPGLYDTEIVVPAGFQLGEGQSSRRVGMEVQTGHTTTGGYFVVPAGGL